MDERPDVPDGGDGRLHGNMLRILGVVSVAAAVVAVWLFSPAMFSDDEDASTTWPWEEPSTAVFTDDEEQSTSTAPAESVQAASTSAEPSSPGAASSAPEPEPETSEPAAPTTDAAAPEPTEAAPQGPACSASLRLDDDWRGNIQVKVDVVNTGENELSGWEVTIAIDGVDVYNTWGMRHVEGDRYRNDDWNGVLDPGEDTVGTFQAEADDDPDLPDTVPCKAFD